MFEISGFTKIMVVSGYSGISNLDSAEIIDLTSNTTTCRTIPNFPIKIRFSVGFLDGNYTPMVCGGNDDQGLANAECYSFNGTTWKNATKLPEPIGATLFLPTSLSGQGGNLIFGGKLSAQVASTKGYFYSNSTWTQVPTTLPYPTDTNCMFQFNSTHILVLGGSQNVTNATFLWDSVNNIWSNGPQLNVARYGAACAKIQTGDNRYSLVVAGGTNSVILDSTEILDSTSLTWSIGPNLPLALRGMSGLTSKNNTMIVVGGRLSSSAVTGNMYEFGYDGQMWSWKELPQRLRAPRSVHVAFWVPDNLAQCS